MDELIERLEQLEKEIFGIIQGNYQLETQDPEAITCTWDLKDHIHVASCRKKMLLSSWLVHNEEELNYCPYCGKPIEVIQ